MRTENSPLSVEEWDAAPPVRSSSLRPRVGRFLPVAVLGALMVGLGACSDITEPEDAEPELQNVIPTVQVAGGTVALRPGAPDGDPSAPVATLQSPGSSIIPGGGYRYVVGSATPFSELYLTVVGEAGYYLVSLGSPTTEAEVILTVDELLEEFGYTFNFAVGTGGGAGAAVGHTVEVLSVGTGDIQVSVSWDAASDVDLHVVDPSGEEIYFANRRSASGGELDLDSNAGCGGQDVRNENITWADGTAPRGQYTIRVNYWSACSVDRTNYVVTVRVRGQATRTFTGTFTGSGSGGGLGSGDVITTFTY